MRALGGDWPLHHGSTEEGVMANSWRPEVDVGEGKWSANALRFATEKEAEDIAFDLMGRWTLVRRCRAAPSDDPPNYRWVDGRLEHIEGAS
jgi:hypothetical protein